MLIDAHDRSPSEPPPRVVSPDWRLWLFLVASAALFVAAGSVTGPAGPLLALAGFTSALLALDRFLGRYSGGLQEWRQ